MSEKNSNSSPSWFFKQSSELELLISAAIVFASIKVGNLVEEMIFSMLNNNVSSSNEWLVILALISLYTSKLLPLSIVAHFVLRFYWLSLVGLRSVFKKDADSTIYTGKFSKFLKSELDLDAHIAKIDKVSSSIFAFSFLTLFAFGFGVSSVSAILIILLPTLADLFGQGLTDSTFIEILKIAILVFFGIYLIDFFTLGFFKKIKWKWFQKIYYPMYRVMSWVTFSFIYRGIYYTLVQYTSKWFMGILLPAYVFLTIFLLNVGYYSTKIFSAEFYDFRVKRQYEKPFNYHDQFGDNVVIHYPFIDTYIVPHGNGYLRFHIPISAKLEDSLLAWCPEIVPINDERFIHWRKYLTTDFNRKEFPDDFDFANNANVTIKCLGSRTKLFIDSVEIRNPEYRFSRLLEPNKSLFSTTIDLDTLKRGNHYLTFQFEYDLTDPDEFVIPFWRD